MKSKLKHIMSRSRGMLWALTETLIISAILVGVCFYFRPDDPLFITGPFPWVLLAPVLAGLLYGLGYGVVSFSIIFLTLYFIEPSQFLDSALARYYMLGGVILTMLTGQFSSFWRTRVRRAEQLSDYIQGRLDNISRAYYMIRLSHDRLEQSLISKPATIRGSLNDIRKMLIEDGGQLTTKTADRLLGLLSQYCAFEKAAIYLMEHKTPASESLAYVGPKSELIKDDTLVKQCLDDPQTLYNTASQIHDEQRSHYMAIIPIIATGEKLQAILTIEEMSFWSLNQTTLEKLSVLVSYFADEIIAVKKAHEFLSRYPDCPSQFASELYKLIQIKQRTNVDSAIAAFTVPKDQRSENIIVGLQRQQRGLDFNWKTSLDGKEVLFNLMPISNAIAVEGYISRLKEWLKEEFGLQLDSDEGIIVRYMQLHSAEPVTIIEQLVGYLNNG